MAKHKLNKKITLLIVGILLVAVVIALLEKRGTIDLLSNNKPALTENDTTTSSAETAQPDFTGADVRQPGNTLDEKKGTAVITENNGASSGAVDTSNPLVSKTGEITLYTPKQNTLITKESQVSGASTLSKVSYRLIDNVSGVISMGELSVSGGKFSGKLSFETGATEGRLDFYGTKPDGSEFSNVEVPVRFK